MDNKKLKNLEFIGIIFTYITGVLLKYSCKIFSLDVSTIIFGAVNGSVWEEIKCFTLPYLIWAAIEFCLIKVPLKTFMVSKTAGLYLIISSYIIELSISLVLFDKIPSLLKIFTALIFCMLSHYLSYRILTSGNSLNDIFILSVFMIILFFSMYLSFTINPPHLNIFKDMKTQTYGIPICDSCYNI